MIPQPPSRSARPRRHVGSRKRYQGRSANGRTTSACCPFHGEKSASPVSPPTQAVHHCFGLWPTGKGSASWTEYSGSPHRRGQGFSPAASAWKSPRDDFGLDSTNARNQSSDRTYGPGGALLQARPGSAPGRHRLPGQRGLTEIAARYGPAMPARWHRRPPLLTTARPPVSNGLSENE